MANIPIISSYGHQVIPCPTVLLTRHTGFDSFKVHHLDHFFDQTIDDLIEHHQTIDAILIGYLDGKHQIGPIMKLLDHYPNAFVFVDPICADNGKFYHGKNQDYVESLKPLIQRADLIKPNITELLILCGFRPEQINENHAITECIQKLRTAIRGNAVITGIIEQNKINNLILQGNTISQISNSYIDRYFPGTGDIFDSVLVSNLLNNKDLKTSAKRATDAVLNAIHVTVNYPNDELNGCMLERVLCKIH